jgi:hypothetical protein
MPALAGDVLKIIDDHDRMRQRSTQTARGISLMLAVSEGLQTRRAVFAARRTQQALSQPKGRFTPSPGWRARRWPRSSNGNDVLWRSIFAVPPVRHMISQNPGR